MPIQNVNYNPSQQALFGRTWSIALGPPNSTAAVQYTALRVQFDVDKLGLGTASKAKIMVLNMSAQSRAKIQKGWNVLFKAGYFGNNSTVFLGVVGPNGAYAKRDGSDIWTVLECGDGEAALVLGTFDKSYPAGATVAQILQDCVTASGLGIGVVTGIPNVTFSKGFTAHGPITTTLNNLTKKVGMQWNVNNANINIIPIKGFDGQTAELISVATGLTGTPSMDNQVLKFTSLLNPRVAPGSLIKFVSENTSLNGFYKINRSHLEGDTHDSKWGQSCEGILFPNAKTSTPVSQGGNFSTAVIP